MSLNLPITADKVSNIYVGSTCSPFLDSCAHCCKITLSDGREMAVGFMPGDELYPLIQEIAQEKMDFSKWADYSSLKEHFKPFDGQKNPSVTTTLTNLFFNYADVNAVEC